MRLLLLLALLTLTQTWFGQWTISQLELHITRVAYRRARSIVAGLYCLLSRSRVVRTPYRGQKVLSILLDQEEGSWSRQGVLT